MEEIRRLCAPEELTRLIPDRFREAERADDPLDFSETVCEIPVVSGNSYSAIKGVVDEAVEAKGAARHETDVRRLTRTLMAVLGTDARHCSPFAVSEALSALGRKDGVNAGLTVRDIAFGLSTLPAERIFPTLAPSVGEMVSALLGADEPLTRDELCEAADISKRSYERHIGALAHLFLVKHINGGWIANVEPWWASDSPSDPPSVEKRTLATGDAVLAGEWSTDVLEDLALILSEQGVVDDDAVFADVWFGPETPSVDEVIDAVPALEPWAPVVATLVDDPFNSLGESPDGDAVGLSKVAVLGQQPAAADSGQTALTLT